MGGSFEKQPFRDNEKGRSVQIKIEEVWVDDVRTDEIVI